MAREAIREWLAIAEIDLKAARNCLRGPEPIPKAAAYHCQQAAEKLVKATLIAQGINPPRSHNIGAMADLLPANHPLRPALSRLEHLAVYAVAYRYPIGDVLVNPPEPSEVEVDARIALIKTAKTQVESLLAG